MRFQKEEDHRRNPFIILRKLLSNLVDSSIRESDKLEILDIRLVPLSPWAGEPQDPVTGDIDIGTPTLAIVAFQWLYSIILVPLAT